MWPRHGIIPQLYARPQRNIVCINQDIRGSQGFGQLTLFAGKQHRHIGFDINKPQRQLNDGLQLFLIVFYLKLSECFGYVRHIALANPFP